MRKRILVVSNNPFYGGGESFLVSTIEPLYKDYELYFIVKNNTLKEKLNTNTIVLKNKNIISNIREVRKLINKIKPDLTIYNGGSSLYISIFEKGIKLLIRHSTNKGISNKLSLKLLLHNILLHLAYYKADKTIHVSNYSRNEQKFFKDKSITIHNGVEIDKIEEKSINNLHTPLKLLYVGRVEESKGINIIAETIAQYPPNIITLDIVGDGTYMEKLKKLKYSNIILHGFQNNVNSYYDNADIFITLPTHENLPISVLDAMNHSLMTICSNVGGLPEIIENHKNGIFVNRDIKDLKKAIDFCINHRELIIEYSNQAKIKCVQNFDIKQTIVKYKQVISTLIRK